MGAKTAIEWTDSSWTPIRAKFASDPGLLVRDRIGWHCEHVSEGCRNCYAESMNKRRGTGLDFKPGHRADVEIFLDEKMLLAPLRWKKPRMIFVCSMTDAFADFVKDEWLDSIFAVMALCPQHTFQVLTKRADRMQKYCSSEHALGRIASITAHWLGQYGKSTLTHKDDGLLGFYLPNVWLGVSAEDQARADERIPLLLQTPAAVRFVSLEPLLGPIDLTLIAAPDKVEGEDWRFNALEVGDMYVRRVDRVFDGAVYDSGDGPYREARLDWVIVGGESGPNARPMHPDWARAIRDDCAAADVPFFFKQWGEHAWGELMNDGRPEPWRQWTNGKPDSWSLDEYSRPKLPLPHWIPSKVGKKRADRLLDGVEHNGFPSLPQPNQVNRIENPRPVPSA